MKRFSIFCILFILHSIQTHALIIGVTPNYPPMSSVADMNNHFFGFEIDIMNNICRYIKMPCQYRGVEVGEVIDQLTSKKIDLAIAAIIIPTEPVAGFIFSIPYLPSNAQFVTSKTSEIKTIADIKDKVVGVRHGTLLSGMMFKNIVTDLFHGHVTIKEYVSQSDLAAALRNKEVDAAFGNAIAADYWVVNGWGLKLIGSRIHVGNGYGIMANLGQEALIGQINQALRDMVADGSFETIYSRYFTG